MGEGVKIYPNVFFDVNFERIDQSACSQAPKCTPHFTVMSAIKKTGLEKYIGKSIVDIDKYANKYYYQDGLSYKQQLKPSDAQPTVQKQNEEQSSDVTDYQRPPGIIVAESGVPSLIGGMERNWFTMRRVLLLKWPPMKY